MKILKAFLNIFDNLVHLFLIKNYWYRELVQGIGTGLFEINCHVISK